MGRPLRTAPGGLVYHVLNRANSRTRLFDKDGDYEAFQRVMAAARERVPMRILSYCVMPNHWHMVLWPRRDGDLSEFVGWLSLTHTQRWHAHRHSAGSDHVYQGRFKSFVIETDAHFLTVCRYVERNAVRAKLVERAEDWRWCSLWLRQFGDAEAKELLGEWPVERPKDWLWRVNRAEAKEELELVRHSVNRGQPFGSDGWVQRTVERLDLISTVRPRGRPRKQLLRKGS